jgi:hypothetical protein
MTKSQPSTAATSVRVGADVDGVGAVLAVDLDADLLADHLELMHRGGAVDVGGDHHDLKASFLELARELAAGGGLTGALQADHHDAGGALAGAGERGVDGAHQRDQLVVADLDEVVLRLDPHAPLFVAGDELDLLAERLLLDGLEEVLDHAELDVRLEQAEPHVLEGGVDHVLGELCLTRKPLTSGAKTPGDRLKHGGGSYHEPPPRSIRRRLERRRLGRGRAGSHRVRRSRGRSAGCAG